MEARKSKMKEGELSIMDRKFLSGQVWEGIPGFDENAFVEEYYFFYGALMDPSTLAGILNIPHLSEEGLIPAKIIGYSLKLWGKNVALVDGPQSAVVRGMAYMIRSREERDALKSYCGMDYYEVSPCGIMLDDGQYQPGWAFEWKADHGLLKEGTFNLQDWLSVEGKEWSIFLSWMEQVVVNYIQQK